MRRFRKIVVNGTEYRWLLRFDDYDYQYPPYLLVIKSACPRSTLKIGFPVREHYLLNEGLPAFYKGDSVFINLNRPLVVSRIIAQCVKDGEAFEQEGYRYLNGVKILEEAGYEIDSIWTGNRKESETVETGQYGGEV